MPTTRTARRRTLGAAAGAVVLPLLALAPGAAVAQAPEGSDPEERLAAVVQLRAEVPADARTADSLGTERSGSGVVIDDDGLVVTIGYLILEAMAVDVVGADSRRVPATVAAAGT